MDVYLFLGGCALVGAAVPGLIAGRRASGELSPVQVAFLRAGPRAAVVAALVALHTDGVVDSARPGTVRRVGVLSGGEPLTRAVYVALHRPTSVRDLYLRRQVRQAISALRADLSRAGLVLSPTRRVFVVAAGLTAFILGVIPVISGSGSSSRVLAAVLCSVTGAVLAMSPRRTLRGYRKLRGLRRQTPRPPRSRSGQRWSPDDPALATALFGRSALLAALPRFAAAGGLLDGGRHAGQTEDATIDSQHFGGLPPGVGGGYLG